MGFPRLDTTSFGAALIVCGEAPTVGPAAAGVDGSGAADIAARASEVPPFDTPLPCPEATSGMVPGHAQNTANV
ncbi:MAG: hypothetical protein OXH09_08010 [Gammaproteobacteria bacterium]|nr:hypothetical protein [Gammaproteobacteria bacterium]